MPARKKAATRKQASPARKTSVSRRSANALALLKADHELVKELFERYEKTRGEDRKSTLAEKICNELKIHARVEEEIFYPAVRGAIRDGDLLDEARVEHATAKDLIAQIESDKPGDELYDAKVKVLGEYIKHHADEEETEMFPKVRKTKLDLAALGERLEARKAELQKGSAAPRKRSAQSDSIMDRMSRTLGIAGA